MIHVYNFFYLSFCSGHMFKFVHLELSEFPELRVIHPWNLGSSLKVSIEHDIIQVVWIVCLIIRIKDYHWKQIIEYCFKTSRTRNFTWNSSNYSLVWFSQFILFYFENFGNVPVSPFIELTSQICIQSVA